MNIGQINKWPSLPPPKHWIKGRLVNFICEAKSNDFPIISTKLPMLSIKGFYSGKKVTSSVMLILSDLTWYD